MRRGEMEFILCGLYWRDRLEVSVCVICLCVLLCMCVGA